MSLILDALRKSEHQRQRQAGPGLAVVPERTVTQRPSTWLLLLGGLLLLNIIVLGALLLTGRQPPATAVTAPPATVSPAPPAATPPAAAPPRTDSAPARTSPAPVTLPTRARRDDVRPLTTEVAPASAPARAAPAPAAETNTGQPATPRPAETTTGERLAGSSPGTTQQATADARLPRFTDLVVRGELNVPHMRVDIHVFSAVPADRFVFINMRKYIEGQATQEGPQVERITRDGVVMDYQGQRFFLSRD